MVGGNLAVLLPLGRREGEVLLDNAGAVVDFHDAQMPEVRLTSASMLSAATGT